MSQPIIYNNEIYYSYGLTETYIMGSMSVGITEMVDINIFICILKGYDEIYKQQTTILYDSIETRCLLTQSYLSNICIDYVYDPMIRITKKYKWARR